MAKTDTRSPLRRARS